VVSVWTPAGSATVSAVAVATNTTGNRRKGGSGSDTEPLPPSCAKAAEPAAQTGCRSFSARTPGVRIDAFVLIRGDPLHQLALRLVVAHDEPPVPTVRSCHRGLTRLGAAKPSPSSSRLAPREESGAGERIRTADLPFTRRLLCQLSYTGGRLVHGSRPRLRRARPATDLRICYGGWCRLQPTADATMSGWHRPSAALSGALLLGGGLSSGWEACRGGR
jgi:hypothetical protein